MATQQTADTTDDRQADDDPCDERLSADEERFVEAFVDYWIRRGFGIVSASR